MAKQSPPVKRKKVTNPKGNPAKGWQGRKAGLTPRQERFIHEYQVDLDGPAAVLRAGFKATARSAAQKACHLLAMPAIRDAIAAGKKVQAQRLEVKADDVLRELLCLARCDIGEAFCDDGSMKAIRDMPEDVRRAVASVEVDESYGLSEDGEPGAVTGRTKKVRFWSKPEALNLLGKHLKLFVDRVQVEDVTDRAAALARARSRLRSDGAGSTTAPGPGVGSRA